MTLVFRAVSTRKERHGIRLEKAYWSALRQAAAGGGRSVAEFVALSVEKHPQARNLTSLLRVTSLTWFRHRLSRLEELTSLHNVNSLVQASPSSAFVLTEDKRILYYNQAFLTLVQSHFQTVDTQTMAKGLRLTLDVPIAGLINDLREKRNKPISTGFALGINDQRIRGRISTLLAPTGAGTMIIAYISSY
jgi:predicted DNA-binding ribbon-helix-helix protein